MGECLSICGKRKVEEDEKLYREEKEKNANIIEKTGRTKKNKTRLPQNFKDLEIDDDNFDTKIENNIQTSEKTNENKNGPLKLNEEIINTDLIKDDKKEENVTNETIKKHNRENNSSVDFDFIKKSSTEILGLDDSKESDSKTNKKSTGNKDIEFVESEEMEEGEKETHGVIVGSDDDES